MAALHYSVPRRPPDRALAGSDVRYVGEPVAIVLAASVTSAHDAVGAVRIDYQAYDAIVDFDQALEGTSIVHPEMDSNVCRQVSVQPPGMDDVFASAAHVVRLQFEHGRQTNIPLECRGLVATWCGGQLDVVMSTQNPHEARRSFARMLGIADNNVRVVQFDVGGGFGQKFHVSREEYSIVLAARQLGRPVCWIEERSEVTIQVLFARTARLVHH
jgi:carbon-monoxide dehydrogenase large subunit